MCVCVCVREREGWDLSRTLSCLWGFRAPAGRPPPSAGLLELLLQAPGLRLGVRQLPFQHGQHFAAALGVPLALPPGPADVDLALQDLVLGQQPGLLGLGTGRGCVWIGPGPGVGRTLCPCLRRVQGLCDVPSGRHPPPPHAATMPFGLRVALDPWPDRVFRAFLEW